MAVAGQVEQDGALLAGLAGRRGFFRHRAQRVRRLRSGEEALAPREAHRLRKDLSLLVRARLNDLVLDQRAKGRRVSVVAQAACVDSVRDEAVAERVHLRDRSDADRVAEIVGVDAARERRARRGLRGDETSARLPALELVADERIRQAGEVRATADAADHDVRVLTRHLHLLLRFEADHGLMEKHVVDD